MSKSYTQDGIAASTQIGKDGTRIASNGTRSETRTPDNAGLARHAGLDAVNADEFVTRSQLDQGVITSWFGLINLQDPVESFLTPTNDFNPIFAPTPPAYFLFPGDVSAGDLIVKCRKINPLDPDATVTCRVYLNRSPTPVATLVDSFSGDSTVRFAIDAAISANDIVFISLEPDQPLGDNGVVDFTAVTNRATI
jgi:hypothetical protein